MALCRELGVVAGVGCLEASEDGRLSSLGCCNANCHLVSAAKLATSQQASDLDHDERGSGVLLGSLQEPVHEGLADARFLCNGSDLQSLAGEACNVLGAFFGFHCFLSSPLDGG